MQQHSKVTVPRFLCVRWLVCSDHFKKVQCFSSSVQSVGRWPLWRLSYQGDDITRSQTALSFIRSLIFGTVRVRKHGNWKTMGTFLPSVIYVPPCLLYQTPHFLFFFLPPTSLGLHAEGWWGFEHAALPGFTSLLIGVHLGSPAAMNAATLLRSRRHFLAPSSNSFPFQPPSSNLCLSLKFCFGVWVAVMAPPLT